MQRYGLAIAKFSFGIAVAAGLLVGCATAPSDPDSETSATDPATSEVTDASTEEDTASGEAGTLEVRANGEDFVRQGFVSKDGWTINFDHVYVHLTNVKAYQTEPPFDPEAGAELDPVTEVVLVESQTVDLAEGDASADPILLSGIEAPAGRYNALSWEMSNASEGPAENQTLVMMGTAEKEGQTIDFTIQIDQEFAYTCGDFVGDERKGILESGSTADLEATFHFDHIFGDGDAPMDDEINTGALGFDPLAAIASESTLTVTMADLEAQLSPDEYETLNAMLVSLGHVGEGHCAEVKASQES